MPVRILARLEKDHVDHEQRKGLAAERAGNFLPDPFFKLSAIAQARERIWNGQIEQVGCSSRSG
jgi:hypothetical protein